jgi:hypothetical protein
METPYPAIDYRQPDRISEDADFPIVLTWHARQRLRERGTSEEHVRLAVRIGRSEPARRGLLLYRLDVPFGGTWCGRRYSSMQVAPVVAREPERLVVVTVYTFFYPAEPAP